MNTSVAIDKQHREGAIEQTRLPECETYKTQEIGATSAEKKPNYELLAAQLDGIKADI